MGLVVVLLYLLWLFFRGQERVYWTLLRTHQERKPTKPVSQLFIGDLVHVAPYPLVATLLLLGVRLIRLEVTFFMLWSWLSVRLRVLLGRGQPRQFKLPKSGKDEPV